MEAPPLERKLIAIFAADVEGYSRLMGIDEEGTLATSRPTVEIASAELSAGLGVLSAFVKAGLVASTGEARRQVKGGGLRVNDIAVADEKGQLNTTDLTPDGVIKLSLGKKKHVLLKAL